MQNKRVALVTGANQGIGLQIAKDLAAHGFTVLVGSRNFERGETAAKEIGPDAHAIQLDVTDRLPSLLRQSASGTSLDVWMCSSKMRRSLIRVSCLDSRWRSTPG